MQTELRTNCVYLGEGMTLMAAEWLDTKEKTVEMRYSKITRANELLLLYSMHKAEAKAGRIYYHNGKQLLCEGDGDGDGFFETLILFDDKEIPVEVFEKKKDGSVIPVSSNRLQEIQAAYTIGNEVIEPALHSIVKQHSESKEGGATSRQATNQFRDK